MPTVSVIIPTYNRPELLEKAVLSVLGQTYRDLEVIVVDDGLIQRAETIISKLGDPRIRYIQHNKSIGGAAARNTGIKNSTGRFVAFLDDDDEWVSEKLAIQMSEFENTSDEVGFCFSAVKNIKDNGEETTQVPEGINDYHELALEWFKGFLTVTLIIKRTVFEDVGYFDENFPSHQESELMLRISKKYKGLGINKPLTLVNMKRGHGHVGGNLGKRIAGREMILKKHLEEFKKHPKFLSNHYFGLGLLYRDNGQYNPAQNCFKKAFEHSFSFRYVMHYVSMMFGGTIYKLFR